jgi:hypothetical protein
MLFFVVDAIIETFIGIGSFTTNSAREALWSNFQTSISNVASASSSSKPFQEPRKVKIERKYLFAGEQVVLVFFFICQDLNSFMTYIFIFSEVVEVLEDSPEARKWPLWKDPLTESSSEAPTAVPLPLLSMPVAPSSNPSSSPNQTPNSSLNPASTSASTKPPARKPGPRKPKTSLASLPGPSKAKKISTLDKSAMDWQAHVQAEQDSGFKDELEANRKAGGYLEKVQFLKRVEERKDATLESLKSTKRRKL